MLKSKCVKKSLLALVACTTVGACVTMSNSKYEAVTLVNCDGSSGISNGAVTPVPAIQRVFVVILENTNAEHALEQPFIQRLASEGALLANSHGITHPSQPNYIALTAGGTLGVTNNGKQRLNEKHLGDLIEEKGKSWKSYAEGYRGGCDLTEVRGAYARKHVPFLSYKNVQDNSERCAKVVPATELQKDIDQGTLPHFSLYIPDNNSNGHDTGVAAASTWLDKNFSARLQDPKFIDGTLFIMTFDESGSSSTNQITTILYGDSVKAGTVSSTCYNHYSVLRTIEEALQLGRLGRQDEYSLPIQDIWK